MSIGTEGARLACVVVARVVGWPVVHLCGVRSRRGSGRGVRDGKGCRGSGVGRGSLEGRGSVVGSRSSGGIVVRVVLPGVVGAAGRVGASRIGVAGGVSPLIGVALGVAAGVALDIALILSAAV